MINSTTYVPILKWKQGEYQALLKLDERIKDRIIPLIEITPPGYDYETKTARNINEHISDLASRLKTKWGREALIDIDPIGLTTDKPEYILKIFEMYRVGGCTVTPVVKLDETAGALAAYTAVIKTDKRGAVLRIKTNNFASQSEIEANITRVCKSLGLGKPDIDLVIDFEKVSIVVNEESTFETMQGFFHKIPDINFWRSFTVAGSSMAESNQDINLYKRAEWLFYKYCVSKFRNSFRLPAFSDYAIGTPKHAAPNLDMRTFTPMAKVRYTFDSEWYYYTGAPVKGRKSQGFGQYKKLCEDLVKRDEYRGEEFSAGDKYIKECAGGKGTGNLSTWIWVATNQHLTKVASDLSNLYGFSI
ncbi:hypothetical protein Emin_1452 [Elusimicrobium minutum Pei191]|uniref:Beta protein n=1 Tax=Elusimicrobium minutum (strain Pei191) TaxID=445932 RepID=B2KEQ4_ELUMP|nr:beta family protein [Elusimicrobium minutum]ACC99000.1 hypothetical protein Emin_1452 [Elusimicrobium minutum Pei191]